MGEGSSPDNVFRFSPGSSFDPGEKPVYQSPPPQNFPPIPVGLPEQEEKPSNALAWNILAVVALVLAVGGIAVGLFFPKYYLGLAFITPALVLALASAVFSKRRALGVVALVVSSVALLLNVMMFAYSFKSGAEETTNEAVVEEKIEEGTPETNTVEPEKEAPETKDKTVPVSPTDVPIGKEYDFIHEMRLRHLEALNEGSKWEVIPDSQENFYAHIALLYILTDMDSALMIQSNNPKAQEMVQEAQELEERFFNQEPLGKDVEIHTSDGALFIYDGDTGEATYTPNAG